MNELDTILDRCLDELLRGATVAACLDRYAEYREELASLLETAVALKDMPRPEPRPSAVRATLVKAGVAMAEQPVGGAAPGGEETPGTRILPFRLSRPVRRLVMGLAAAMVLVILGGASADTVPGDLFYPIKLAKERASFLLTTRPDHKVELRLAFADRRLGELVEMTGSTGEIDPDLVRRLLYQGSQALEEARRLPRNRLEIFLKKIEHFNMYEQKVLEQLAPRVPASQRPLVQHAIDMCGERGRWMRRVRPESLKGSSSPRDSCWSDDCGRD